MAIIINRHIYTSAVKDFRYNELLNASVLEEKNRVSAISMQTILSELENGKGKQFDPKIVDLFMDDAIGITGESA